MVDLWKKLFFLLAFVYLLLGFLVGIRLGGAVGFSFLDPILPYHYSLMINGFFLSLLSTERAVGSKQRIFFLPPVIFLAGHLDLLFAEGNWWKEAMWIGSIAYGLAMAWFLLKVRQAVLIGFFFGSISLAFANGFLLFAYSIGQKTLIPLFLSFIVQTILAERMVLARVFVRHRKQRLLLYGVMASYLALIPAVGFGRWIFLLWSLLLASSAVLFIFFDISRRSIKLKGMARFVGIHIFIAYQWLLVSASASLSIFFSPSISRGAYDLCVHAITLGFMFSMIFAHIPILIHSAMGRVFVYSPGLYGVSAFFQLSLVMRFVLGPEGVSLWANAVGILAYLLFVRFRSKKKIKNI